MMRLRKSAIGAAAPQRRFVLAAVVIVLAAATLAATISGAVRRGMHHAIAVSPGEEIAVAIALSDSVYHVRLGYVGLASVLTTLHSHWNQGAGPDGWSNLAVLIHNFHDRHILNDGIRAAASLGPQHAGYFTDGSLITTIYDDMGEVDYDKISFALFGFKIESLFKTYFLLLGISALTFILTFRTNVYALAVLLCTLFTFFIELHLAVFNPNTTPTFFGMRHASTMAFVPMWYFTFLLIFPRKPSRALVGGALLQVAIMVLAWRVRGSVAWVFLFLVLLTAALTAIRYWPFDARRLQSWLSLARSWPMLLRDALRWPVVLLLFGLLANGVYNQQSRHLIYSTDDVIPHHGLWWVATDALYEYAQRLGLSPNFAPRVTKTDGTPEGWWFLRDYFDRIHMIPWAGDQNLADPVPGLQSPWTEPGGLKYRLVDKAMERMFFESTWKHPLSAVRVYLEYKLPGLVEVLYLAFMEAPNLAWLLLIGAAGAGVFILLFLFDDHDDPAALRKIALTSVAVLAAVTLPNLWGYVNLAVMDDVVLISVTVLSLWIGLVAYGAFHRMHGKTP